MPTLRGGSWKAATLGARTIAFEVNNVKPVHDLLVLVPPRFGDGQVYALFRAAGKEFANKAAAV